MDSTRLLAQHAPHLTPAPTRFVGTYGEFFSRFVEPNLPSPQRVDCFDHLLTQYLEAGDPGYLIRSVAGLNRREAYRNSRNCLILPTDNSPGWWLHCYLLSDLPMESADSLFRQCPRHMHDIKLRDNLSKAGFHLAHLLNAKNGDTAWNTWDRRELRRRMILNLHPWNWCLVGKPDWTRQGGREDLLSWIIARYAERYGAPYLQWRAALGLPMVVPPVSDPQYAYEQSNAPPKTRDRNPEPGQRTVSPDTGDSSSGPNHERRLNRPMVRRDWQGRSITLRLSLSEGRFVVSHDRLLEWALANTNIGQTVSWRRNGLYSWPVATKAILAFLANHSEP